MEITVDGVKRRVLKGAQVNGAGLELLCKYYIYTVKMRKEIARKKLREKKRT